MSAAQQNKHKWVAVGTNSGPSVTHQDQTKYPAVEEEES